MSTPGEPAGPSIAALGERGLIARLRERLPSPPAHLLIGPGDDAAVDVPERGALEVVTTDALVEGIHFDWRFSSPADIGYKALAVNLSDIAAMGGTPRLALLSLVLPDAWPIDRFDAFLDGLLDLAARERVALAGGNISRSPGPLIVDVTVLGSVRPRRILTRSGGRPGDALFVTGFIGDAAAGLEWLRNRHSAGRAGDDGEREGERFRSCLSRHRRPVPRTRIGGLLGRTRAATACIDLSDGLAEGLHQLAESSGTGARVDASALPISAAARDWFGARGTDPVLAAARGGEDYELLFAVRPGSMGRLRHVTRLAGGVPITRVGELTSDRGVILERTHGPEVLPRGFAHF